ncbi:MAG: hypothetical protein KGQ37_01880 [Hyphomicrobiales bacterium]|nr:hypothetical protein [Hyphomicrobiales bacterium]
MVKTFSLAAAAVAVVLASSSAFAEGTFNHDGMFKTPGAQTSAPYSQAAATRTDSLGRYVAVYYNTANVPAYNHADAGSGKGN